MHGTFSPSLVSLSLLIAMLASYTVLDLTEFISFLERPKVKHTWLAAGAVAMGIGIWSMHFIGMLAFSLPIPLGYDWRITAASLLLAIFVSYFALNVVIRPQLTVMHLVTGGVLMGIGIAGMHYVGMAAMRMEPAPDYDLTLVAASLVIAIVASTAALWIANALSTSSGRNLIAKRLGASLIMGIAITGMHYTGMGAVKFLPGSICAAAKGTNMQWLATTVTLLTLGILISTLIVSRFDARTAFLRRMTKRVEGQIRRRSGDFEGAADEHTRTTEALHLVQAQMAHEIEERKAIAEQLERENESLRGVVDDLKAAYAKLLQSTEPSRSDRHA